MRSAARGLFLCWFVVGCATTPVPAPQEGPPKAAAEVAVAVVPEGPAQPLPDPKPATSDPMSPGIEQSITAESPIMPTPELAPRPTPETCTYTTYQWSTAKGKSVNRRTVQKKYAELTAEEKAPDFHKSGCTVCSEDQVEVAVAGLPAVEVCWYYAPMVMKALEALQADPQFRIRELVGYRCGQTRGRLVDGLRTEFSNHSFGTAIDINASFNGLYRRCDLKGKVPTSARDIARCTKGMGGAWNPEKNYKETVTPGSKAYQLFTTLVGWKWGGEIDGRLKDFMHFSVDGF